MSEQKEILEFAITMARHLPDVHPWSLNEALYHILRCGAKAKRYAEYRCNYGLTDRQEKADERNNDWLKENAEYIGCGVLLGGDPRGCVVKLTLPDGYTDDFGRTGVCVPTA